MNYSKKHKYFSTKIVLYFNGNVSVLFYYDFVFQLDSSLGLTIKL